MVSSYIYKSYDIIVCITTTAIPVLANRLSFKIMIPKLYNPIVAHIKDTLLYWFDFKVKQVKKT